MEPSCGRLREFLSRLASLLGRLRASWNQHMLDFILDTIFEWIFNRFELRKTTPELRKIIIIYRKKHIFKRSRSFNVTSLPDRFFEPTWLHVGFQNPRKTLLGAPLEALERTWSRLGASWTHLRASWRHLGATSAHLKATWSEKFRLATSWRPLPVQARR